MSQQQLENICVYVGDDRPIIITFTVGGSPLTGVSAMTINVTNKSGGVIDTGTGADQTGGVWHFTMGGTTNPDNWPTGNFRYTITGTFTSPAGDKTIGEGQWIIRAT